MQRSTRWIVVAMVAGLALSACSKAAEEPEATGHATVKLEAVKGLLDLHWHGAADEVRISKVARYREKFTPARRFPCLE